MTRIDCKKEGVSWSFISNPSNCICKHEKKKQHKSCCHKEDNQTPTHKEKNDRCCHNDVEVYMLDEDYTFQSKKIESDNILYAAVIYYSLFAPQISMNSDPEKVNYTLYKPPLPDRDIPVFIQSFLI